MRILLINNNIYPYLNTAQYLTLLEKFFPLGLFSIACYLKKMGHEVSILDALAYRLDENAVGKVVAALRPRIVGFANCFYSATEGLLRLIKLFKTIDPGIITVVGGIVPSYLSKEMMDFCREIDYIVQGEGEIPFGKLVRGIEEEGSMSQIKGLAYRDKDNGCVINSGREYLDTFGVAPESLRDLFIPYHRKPYMSPRTVVSIEASRGCPFACRFCVVRGHWGPQARFKTPQMIVDEMEGYYKIFGVRTFRFIDNTFTYNKQMVHAFIDELKRRGLHKKLGWGILTRVNCLDRELIRRLKEGNCYGIALGVESYSQETLDYYKKGITITQIMETFRLIQEHRIRTKAFFVIDQYRCKNEQELMVERSRIDVFQRKLKPDSMGFIPFLVYPHTRIYDKYVSDKLIEDQDPNPLLRGRLIPARYVSENAVFKVVAAMYLSFGLRKHVNRIFSL